MKYRRNLTPEARQGRLSLFQRRNQADGQNARGNPRSPAPFACPRQGRTVEWTWKSNTHSVTSGDPTTGTPDGLFDSEIQNKPFTFSYTFTSPGTFDYFCVPHRALGMIGTVTVAGGTPTPTPTPSPTPTLTQLASNTTRAMVGAGDSISIEEFVIQGNQPKKIIVRGLGPSLGALGVPDPLADPVLSLYASSGTLVATNDYWRDIQPSRNHRHLYPVDQRPRIRDSFYSLSQRLHDSRKR